MELHAVKGVGKEHAKWSPVGELLQTFCLDVRRSSNRRGQLATASYRLHPLIILNPEKPVPPHAAKKFAKCFSPGVIKVDKNGKVPRFFCHSLLFTD